MCSTYKHQTCISLAKKYFSIPPEKHLYYPNIPSNIQEIIEEDEDDTTELVPAQSRARKKARKEKNTNADINPVGARKPGRPKQALLLQMGCQSILYFFQRRNN